jgi:hypothetical protein
MTRALELALPRRPPLLLAVPALAAPAASRAARGLRTAPRLRRRNAACAHAACRHRASDHSAGARACHGSRSRRSRARARTSGAGPAASSGRRANAANAATNAAAANADTHRHRGARAAASLRVLEPLVTLTRRPQPLVEQVLSLRLRGRPSVRNLWVCSQGQPAWFAVDNKAWSHQVRECKE